MSDASVLSLVSTEDFLKFHKKYDGSYPTKSDSLGAYGMNFLDSGEERIDWDSSTQV